MQNVIPVQIFRGHNAGIGQAHQIGQTIHALFGHIVHESVFHVFHNPVAVLHDGSRNLQGGSAKQNKLGRILPGFNAANAGDGQTGNARAQLLDKAQGHRFDGLAGKTGDGRLAIDNGQAHLALQININDGLDGIDGGYPIGASGQAGFGHGNHVRYIWCHLGQKRQF